jgi:hypothetical protein
MLFQYMAAVVLLHLILGTHHLGRILQHLDVSLGYAEFASAHD